MWTIYMHEHLVVLLDKYETFADAYEHGKLTGFPFCIYKNGKFVGEVEGPETNFRYTER